jgi:excisionase family DNA binding protein
MPTAEVEQPLMYSVTEAAALMKLSNGTVYTLVASGELASVRVGGKSGGIRVPRIAIEAWIKTKMTGGASEA